MPQDTGCELPKHPSSMLVEEQAFLAVLRTADWLQRELAKMLKPYDLSPVQYNALRIMRGAGPEGLPCSEISERMITRDPDVTRLLARLEKVKLAQRSRDREDHRVIRGRITKQGLDLLKNIDPQIGKFHRDLLGHMGEGKLTTLIRLLSQGTGD